MVSVRRAVGVSVLSVSLLGGGLEACLTQLLCNLFNCEESESAEGDDPTLTVLIERIDLKIMPLGVDDDENPKDVTLKSRRKFKPSKGSDAGLDRRFRMLGKTDESSACLSGHVDFTTPANASMRLAIDTSSGLVDGESLAFLERRVSAPEEGEPGVVRVEAVWNEGINGLTLRARVDGDLMGDTADYADTTEVFVQIVHTGVNSYTVAGDLYNSFGDGTSLINGLPAPAGGHRFAFGVEQLGKKGRFWFTQLAVEVSTSYLGGAEAALAYLAGAMIINVDLAEVFFGFPTALATNVDAALGPIAFSASALFSEHMVAMEKELYEESTDLKKLHKIVTKANQRGLALGKKADAAAAKGAKAKVLKGSVKKLRDALEALLGITHGFDTLSAKRLGLSVELYLTG
ncbi:MAG: hypothetical protein DHS20C15_19100 [Planctomycetota bacterium]|nr:MAG: hypothetical protein DHS20C15_19100 [Planctomycetota bacterium]